MGVGYLTISGPQSISTQYGIIVIIVLIFYNLLDLLLSKDSCKEWVFWTER